MITKTISVEGGDNEGTPPIYTAIKIVKEQASAPGEKVSPVPKRVEVYKGEDRAAFQEAMAAARREMYA